MRPDPATYRSIFHSLRIPAFLLSCLLILTSSPAQIPAGYYNPAAGLSGEQLQVALYNIIKGHTVVSYTPGVWNAFYATDVRADAKVFDMYSDIPGGTPSYEYDFGSDQCGSGGGGFEGSCYSREHSFPKSWFNDTSPMNTDLFHIYPVDQYVNNHHSNYPYGPVASPTWTSMNGCKVGPCSTLGYTGTVFEPRDEYKGDFARSYFYMATRYENVIATWKNFDPDGAVVLNGTSYPAFYPWYINMLVAWNNQDPVSAKEIARNDSVYKIQNNRNPYIDHPEYVAAIWSPTGPNGELTNHVTAFTALQGVPSYSAIKLTWSDATGAIVPDGYLIRGSNTGYSYIQDPIDGLPVPDSGLDKNVVSGNQAWTFTGLNPSTTCYFKIFPYTNSGTSINFKTDGTVPAAIMTTTVGISQLLPGDIAIIEMDSSDPDKFSFIALRQLNAGTVIGFTDNGFSSPTTVRTGEGSVTYTAPAVIPVGTIISWSSGMNVAGTGWNTATSGFQLSTGGDQVFAYQGTWGSGQTMIFGAQLGNTSWISTGSATSNTSYLPATLEDNITAVTFPEKNGNYNLLTTGSVNALGALMAHPANWTKSAGAMVTPNWSVMITQTTMLNQNATVQNMLVGIDEHFTIQPGIKLTVFGTMTISNGF